jgi:DNA polymerase-3 subunit chi
VSAVEAARARWKDYKNAGHALTYWQQSDAGRWEQK